MANKFNINVFFLQNDIDLNDIVYVMKIVGIFFVLCPRKTEFLAIMTTK